MESVRTWIAFGFFALVLACHRSTSAEQKVFGTWEYSGMDDLVAWMSERPWLPERKPHVTGRTIGSGTWSLDGDSIVIDHQPSQQRLSPGEKPFSRRAIRLPIREFDSESLVRADGHGTFRRVKPWWRFW
jgi:hypothetical protein